MSSTIQQTPANIEIGAVLDHLAAGDTVQSNRIFQLALVLARIAIEPCTEADKDDAAPAVPGLVRAHSRSNVVRLFGDAPAEGRAVARPSGI